MRLGRVPHDPGYMPALVFPGSLRRLTLALVAGVGFVVAGAILALTAPPGAGRWLVGILAVVFFGALAIAGALAVVRDVSRVGLSRAGVHGGSRSDVFVPWAVIEGVRPLTIRGTSMVGLRVSDPGAVRMPRRFHAVRSLNRDLYGVDTAVAAPTDAARAAVIALAIVHYARESERRRELGRALPTIDELASGPAEARRAPAE